MADSTPSSSASSSEIQINIKGPNELKLQISIALDKTVAELKQAIAAKSDVEADRQRLIYSGATSTESMSSPSTRPWHSVSSHHRIYKDDDPLSTYKIQSAHTIHMVKGAARPGGTSAGSSGAGAAPQQLPTMQAGQNPSDPLTLLNGPMGHGVLAGFNPFADMGLNQNDPNMMQGMMENPAFLQQMSGLMANPAVLDQIIASNPQLAAMGPQVRQVMQSEAFRQMISNPQALQSMLRMSALMRESGLGPAAGPGDFSGLGMGASPFGGGAAAGGFPAPGVPSYAQGQTPPQTQSPAPTSPGGTPASTTPAPGSPGAAPGAQQNPYAALAGLFGSMPPPPPAGGGASPFGMVDPALVQQLLGGFGGPAPSPGAAASPFGAFGGLGGASGAPAAPADTRSPEERFSVQLGQLQDMGFTNAAQNVRALLATGGNVHAAIEYILGGGGV
ncbi:hypothetical protein M0805_004556 [Coniferiporia weirii]|nr:hypothetical protein M0805_004556 [Coniferiporia weirii]